MNDFGKTAEKLSGNPLGIIALFIVLLYGIAALVLSSSAGFLAGDERKPIIWLLVIFPFVVLFVFAWLVSQHHTKLYAPKDFLNDETFLKALSPQEIEDKRQKELESYNDEIVNTPAQLETHEAKPSSSKSSISIQELKEADELATKYVKSKYNIDLLSYQELRRGNDSEQLDGIAMSNQNIQAFEFQLINGDKVNRIINSRMGSIALKALRLASYSENTKAKLVYVLLVKGLNDISKNIIQKSFDSFAPSSPIPLELDLVNYDDLKNKYSLST